jgi:hypothetical protein
LLRGMAESAGEVGAGDDRENHDMAGVIRHSATRPLMPLWARRMSGLTSYLGGAGRPGGELRVACLGGGAGRGIPGRA